MKNYLFSYILLIGIVFLVIQQTSCIIATGLWASSHAVKLGLRSIRPINFCNSSNHEVISIVSSSATSAASSVSDQLSYMQTMFAGAISRTMAQTLMHPAITYKTIMQLKGSSQIRKPSFERLLRGMDAQFLLSLPHGAFHFFVIDEVKNLLSGFIPKKLDFLSDFTSSAISTIICSIISTPQMVITDRLMAGVYPTFPSALLTIIKTEGIPGFYAGWWPALAQKIPSYGLTWVFFQQFKTFYRNLQEDDRRRSGGPSHEINFILGAVAAAASVTVMIPMDTIKTRLVIQSSSCPTGYKGVADCFVRILREEGVGAFYRALPARLIGVVPMIAIQFGVYEGIKSKFMEENLRVRLSQANRSIKKEALRQISRAKHLKNRIKISPTPSVVNRSSMEKCGVRQPCESQK